MLLLTLLSSESEITVVAFVKLEKKGKKYLPLKLFITMSPNTEMIGNSNIILSTHGIDCL